MMNNIIASVIMNKRQNVKPNKLIQEIRIFNLFSEKCGVLGILFLEWSFNFELHKAKKVFDRQHRTYHFLLSNDSII